MSGPLTHPRRRRLWLALGVVIAVLLSRADAAPAPKSAGPAPDHVTGPLLTRLDSPVVRVADGDDGLVWLVFRTPADEADHLAKFAPETLVTARGTLAVGGRYRYLIVSNVAKAD